MTIKRLPSEGTPPNLTDSAGFPWEGRTFDHHGTAFADDEGHTPEEILSAVGKVRSAVSVLTQAQDEQEQRQALHDLAQAHAHMVAASTRSRFLIPLIAEAGDFGVTPEGKTVEKSQELSIVTVKAPDGRAALPVFSSVAAMEAWNTAARPIPVPGAQVALAAAQENTDIVIIDPGQPATEYAIRRPLLEAFALGEEQVPSWADPNVNRAFEASIRGEAHVTDVVLAPGDPAGRLQGAETVVGLALSPGLSQEALQEIVSRLHARWSQDETIAHRADSLSVQIRKAVS